MVSSLSASIENINNIEDAGLCQANISRILITVRQDRFFFAVMQCELCIFLIWCEKRSILIENEENDVGINNSYVGIATAPPICRCSYSILPIKREEEAKKIVQWTKQSFTPIYLSISISNFLFFFHLFPNELYNFICCLRIDLEVEPWMWNVAHWSSVKYLNKIKGNLMTTNCILKMVYFGSSLFMFC